MTLRHRHLLQRLVLLLLTLLYLVPATLFESNYALAHSASRTAPPVRHYDFLGGNAIRLFRNNDQWIELSFTAFNQSYYMQLERNTDLILPSAKVVIYNQDGTTSSASSLLNDMHAFRGQVYHINSKHKIENVGWGRILFHADPFNSDNWPELTYEGAFTHLRAGGMHHISTVRNYGIARRDGVDVDITSPLSRPAQHRTSQMIVFRDHFDSFMSFEDPFGDPFSIKSVSSRSALVPRALSDEHGCSFEHTEVNQAATKYFLKRNGFFEKHNPFERRDATPSTCFGTSKRILPMAAAADCAYAAAVGTPSQVLQKILSDWNSASQVYEQTFNIALGLIQVKIMQTCGNVNGENLAWNRVCSDSYTVNDRLSDFSQWRGSKSQDNAGLWHIMTQCNSGPSVGVAWLATLCQTNSFSQQSNGVTQYVSGTGLSSIVPTEWKVVAHEIGHNFGAIHDCTSTTCPYTCTTADDSCTCCPCGSGSSCDCQGQYLMHPTDNSALSQFSPCSTQFMCGYLPKLGTCLTDPAKLQTISSGICGNGVVEANEQCDCGSNCDKDKCCDGTTCKFKNNAVCDDLNDLCCSGCQLISNGSVCRQANDICAFTAHCDGKSATCPQTVLSPNGQGCQISNGTGTTCASGVCTSRDLQCVSLSAVGGYQTVQQCSGQNYQCALYCQTASGTCLALNGYFLDGTPCGYQGFCSQGLCSANGVVSTIVQFFQTQPQIAIPITIVISLLLLACVGFCVQSCCRRRTGKRRAAALAYTSPQSRGPPPPNGAVGSPYTTTPVIPAPNQTTAGSFRATAPPPNWVDPSLYNGPEYSEENLRFIDSQTSPVPVISPNRPNRS